MICYRDRTYCDCAFCITEKCDKRLTDDVMDAAIAVGLPVSVSDFSSVCGIYRDCNSQESNI